MMAPYAVCSWWGAAQLRLLDHRGQWAVDPDQPGICELPSFELATMMCRAVRDVDGSFVLPLETARALSRAVREVRRG